MLEKIERLEKIELVRFADSIIEGVLEGKEYAIKVDVKLKALEEVAKDARGKIKHLVKKEASELDSIFGVPVSIRNGYATLNFSEDEEYARLEKALKERKELLTQAFKMKEKGQELVVDGEQVPVVSVKNYTEDSIVYSFK